MADRFNHGRLSNLDYLVEKLSTDLIGNTYEDDIFKTWGRTHPEISLEEDNRTEGVLLLWHHPRMKKTIVVDIVNLSSSPE